MGDIFGNSMKVANLFDQNKKLKVLQSFKYFYYIKFKRKLIYSYLHIPY